MEWGLTVQQTLDISALTNALTRYDDRFITIVIGSESVYCPLILLARYSEIGNEILANVEQFEVIELAIPEHEKPLVEQVVEFMRGEAISVDLSTVFSLARICAILRIPRLAEHVFPIASFVLQISEIYKDLLVGVELDPERADIVAPFFLQYPEFRSLVNAVSHRTLQLITTSVNFRAPNEDAVLDLVIDKPGLLVDVVHMQCLSPDGVRRLSETYKEGKFNSRTVMAQLERATSAPNHDWKRAAAGNRRYDMSYESMMRFVYEGGRHPWLEDEIGVQEAPPFQFESFPSVTIQLS